MILSAADGAAQTQWDEQCDYLDTDNAHENRQNDNQVVLQGAQQLLGAAFRVYDAFGGDLLDVRRAHSDFKLGAQLLGGVPATACGRHLEGLLGARQL